MRAWTQGLGARIAYAAIAAIVIAAFTIGSPLQAANIAVRMIEPNYDDTATWTFDPVEVRVKSGDIVVWTNSSGAARHS